MGTSRNIGELGDKFQRYAFVFGNANRAAVQAATQVYKEKLLVSAASATGGDYRLSRWRSRLGAVSQSPKLGAGYEIFGYENAKGVLRPRPYGIWALLEGGSNTGQPYVIGPFKYKRGRRRGEGTSAVTYAGLPTKRGFAAYVIHPPQKPRNTFSNAVPVAEPGAKRVFAEAHRRGLLEVFK